MVRLAQRVIAPSSSKVNRQQDAGVTTNFAKVTRQSNPAIVVWRGNERAEGWELGIELIDPKMDFWGLEL